MTQVWHSFFYLQYTNSREMTRKIKKNNYSFTWRKVKINFFLYFLCSFLIAILLFLHFHVLSIHQMIMNINQSEKKKLLLFFVLLVVLFPSKKFHFEDTKLNEMFSSIYVVTFTSLYFKTKSRKLKVKAELASCFCVYFPFFPFKSVSFSLQLQLESKVRGWK